MSLIQSSKGKAGSVKAAVKKKLSPAKLEKAKIQVITNPRNISSARGTALTVQFNPSEYSIQRHARASVRRPLGRDSDPSRAFAVSGDLATLSVTLYFDTITDLHNTSLTGMVSAVKSGGTAALKSTAAQLAKDQFLPGSSSKSADTCAELMRLLKFNSETHQPPLVNFVWGPLDFEGRVESIHTTYTMFSSDGTPVRAKVDLRITGSERQDMNLARQLPFESPDRTKERTLAQGDQLWMVASREYDDPAQWKVIAEANDILNPRKLETATTLKVPSIK